MAGAGEGRVLDESHIRILHIFPTFGVGGQQVRLAALIKSLGNAYHHDIITLTDDAGAQALLSGQGNAFVNVVATPKSQFISRKAISLLKNEFTVRRPDILCTYNWGAVEAVFANRIGAKLPHIHFEDGFGPDEDLQRQKLQRVLARRVLLHRSIIVTPSSGLTNLALRRWKLPEERIQYIPNGIDTSRFCVDRNYNRSPLVIGSVGTMRPEKNFKRLLRVYTAASLGKSARLEVVGDGPEYTALLEQARTIDSVTLPGQNNHPERAYASFDIFAMSSDTEQMPLSLMEAMAAGLPVVATDVGDIADMVSSENQRLITAKDDEAALVSSLTELAGDSALRRALGEANLKKAQNDFSLEVMVNAHRALYHSVLG